jgi:hypothetical protein
MNINFKHKLKYNVFAMWWRLVSYRGNSRQQIGIGRRWLYYYLNGTKNEVKFNTMYLTCPWNQGSMEIHRNDKGLGFEDSTKD